MSILDVTDERPGLTRIGAGSFASVYVYRGSPLAFKEVADGDDAAILRKEYHTLGDIYRDWELNPKPLFSLPKPYAIYAPTSNGFSSQSCSAIVTQGIMQHFQRATYAMDRVNAVPLDLGMFIAQTWFPPQYNRHPPALCRLYLGKDYSEAPVPRFINTNNFPLDEYRYNILDQNSPNRLKPISQVARGMGQILARLHHALGLDARDVEFVLGGDGGSNFTYFLIDFNQVCSILRFRATPA